MNLRTDQLIQRGREAFERGDYPAALTDFQDVLERHPDFADIHHLAGICLGVLGWTHAALEEFDEAIALNEGYVEAHVNRAITLQELGRYDEADASFEQAKRHEARTSGRFSAAVSARLADAHVGVGDVYLAAGAAAEAAEQYRAALELRPGYLDVRHKLARTLLHAGDLNGARAELEQVLEANPRFLSARLSLGLVHFRRGDLDAAARIWEECRAQDEASAQARAYLAMLDRHAITHESSDGDG